MAKSFFEKLGKSLHLEDEQDEDIPTDSEQQVEEITEPLTTVPEGSGSQSSSLEGEYESSSEDIVAPEKTEASLDEYSEEDVDEEATRGPHVTLAASVATKKTKTTKKKMAVKKKRKKTTEKHEEEGQLTVDVYETDDAIFITSTIAGVDSDDLDINITPDSVSIRGTRENKREVKTKDYFYQECYWGAFSRSIILPTEIDPDKAHASLTNGILTIRLPKLSRSQHKKLRVKSS